MPLVTTPRASSTAQAPSTTPARAQVSLNQPSPSSARVEALKARLTAPPPAAPIAPRQAGSTARREAMAKQTQFAAAPQTAQVQLTSARGREMDFSKIAPPPSGLNPDAVEPAVAHVPKSAEAVVPSPAAMSEELDPQHAALARQAQQIRKAQQELKAAKNAWEQEKASYIPKTLLQTDALKALAEAGITSDKLVELQINQAASQDPNQILLNQIAELKAQIAGITDPEKGTFAQRDQAAYNQVVSQIRQDAKLLVDSNPTYGTIKSEGKSEEVVELITQVFEKEGVALDVEEAAQLVEDKLVERLLKQYERISQYEKIKARTGQPAETAVASQAKLAQSTVNTLTNAGAVMKPLSPRDRAILKVQEALDSAKGR